MMTKSHGTIRASVADQPIPPYGVGNYFRTESTMTIITAVHEIAGEWVIKYRRRPMSDNEWAKYMRDIGKIR